MREMLDPISPASLRPLFKGVFRHLQRGKALEEMVFFKGCYLLALDGTGYFASKTIQALVGFQGLILKCASETLNLFIRPLKNKHLKGDAGRKNRVVRHCYIHDPGIQQEPFE